VVTKEHTFFELLKQLTLIKRPIMQSQGQTGKKSRPSPPLNQRNRSFSPPMDTSQHRLKAKRPQSKIKIIVNKPKKMYFKYTTYQKTLYICKSSKDKKDWHVNSDL